MTSYPPPEAPYVQQPPQPSFIPQYNERPSADSPRAPLPPGFYPNTDPSLQQTPPQQAAKTPQSNGDSQKSASRLRKACDSCSVRKVKVGAVAKHKLRFFSDLTRVNSAMNPDLHAKRVSPWRYHVPSKDQAKGVARPIAWPSPSRNSVLNLPLLQVIPFLRRPHMPPIPSHLSPSSKSSRPMPSARGQSYNC